VDALGVFASLAVEVRDERVREAGDDLEVVAQVVAQ